VYVHSGTLFGVPFDVAKLEVKGAPTPLVDDLAANAQFGGGQFDFSRDGKFVYMGGRSAEMQGWQVVWMDANGKTQPFISAPGHYVDPRLSPDGRRLAVGSRDAGGGIVIYDVERASPLKLTLDSVVNRSPIWAPDGKHITYVSESEGSNAIMWIRADGGGEPQRLRQSNYFMAPGSFSPTAGAWHFPRVMSRRTRIFGCYRSI
jgi:hypothetical protein